MIDWDSCVLWLDSKYFSESYWWDRSKYRNDGVVHGAKWKSNAFYFDGVNDYITIPNTLLPNPNKFTILAWIYPYGENNDNNYNAQLIVDLRGQYEISLLWIEEDDANHPASIRSCIYDGSQEYNLYSPDNSIGKEWHFVGSMWDGTDQRIYYDGNEDSQEANNPAHISGYQSKIGKDYTTSNRLWFYGKISLVIIFKKALSKDIIDIIYNITYRKVM